MIFVNNIFTMYHKIRTIMNVSFAREVLLVTVILVGVAYPHYKVGGAFRGPTETARLNGVLIQMTVLVLSQLQPFLPI